jgi:hypothetical protein
LVNEVELLIKPLLKRLSWNDNRCWILLLAFLSAAAFWFLSHNHSFVPMWVEGMIECLETELIMFGYDKQQPHCWLEIGTLRAPLALNSYIGPGWFYAYAPTAYLWFHRITTDPYIYRYTSIFFFLVSGWILYYLLTKYYKPSISFYSAAAFMTSPLLLLGTLTDHGILNTMLPFVLLTAFLFSGYIKGGSVALLLASAMMLGMTLLGRIEAFVWLMIPFAVYLLLARPSLILDRWRQTNHKPAVVVSALGLFCLGASPVIAYNLLCPGSNIFSFTANTIFRHSFDDSSMSIWGKLAGRIDHFWNFNLLNIWPLYELHVANYVMAVMWIVCACILAIRWIRKRRPSLLLVMVPVIVVLSVLTTGGLRSEHLMILEPAALLVITSALAYVEEFGPLKKVAHVAFIVLIVGNIAVAALDWRSWNQLPSNSQTLLNQSDPVLLASYLSEHHADDRILYTNIGIPQYMKYMTVGHLKGEDITDMTGTGRFIQAVKLNLSDESRRRVFVAVSKEHDGFAGAVPHTKLLYNMLDQYSVPHEVIQLSNERNSSLYDLIVVEKGVKSKADSARVGTLVVSVVVDVRVVEQPGGGTPLIGSILGTGFKPGDAVRINSDLIFPTVYGNDTWITFSIPLEALGSQSSFTLEVFREGTSERSNTFTVRY